MQASGVWGSLAILTALGIAGWAVLGAQDDPIASAPVEDASALAALRAENAWLKEELERVRTRRALTSEHEARKGPALEGNPGTPPPRKQPERKRPQHLLTPGQQADLAATVRDPSTNLAVRLAALRRIPVPEAQPLVLELIGEPDVPPRLLAAALSMLVLLPGSAVPTAVTQLAADRDAPLNVRALALSRQMNAQPREAEPEFRRFLVSDDAKERRWAGTLLKYASDPVFKPAVEEALELAGTVAEKQPLIGALATFKGKHWATYQMTGPPDTPIEGDLGTAWASRTGDMGEVGVELDYRYSVVPSDVRIRETHNAGAISKILAKAPGGTWAVLWEGTAPRGEAPRWFEPRLNRVYDRTSTLRIVLDTNRVAGWNEIDAVELIGDRSRQWAVAARASSSYAGE